MCLQRLHPFPATFLVNFLVAILWEMGVDAVDTLPLNPLHKPVYRVSTANLLFYLPKGERAAMVPSVPARKK